MAKLPKLSSDEYAHHTLAQERWLEEHAADWAVVAVLTGPVRVDASDLSSPVMVPEGKGERPVRVVLRNRAEERTYDVAPDGSETLADLTRRG